MSRIIEVEAGFPIKGTREDAEQRLLAAGFVSSFKTERTVDIYFGKNIVFNPRQSEEDLKRSMVRCRGMGISDIPFDIDKCDEIVRVTFENLQLLNHEYKVGKHRVDYTTAVDICSALLEDGFEIVFETEKTDWIYKKGNCWHQIQDIKGIGLVDYVYNEDIFNKGYSEAEQFELLQQQMIDLGFTLKYPDRGGIDKLRTLLSGKMQFSTNQIGCYGYQEHHTN